MLEGHSKGVNTIDFFAAGGKSCLVTGSDDQTVKVCHEDILKLEFILSNFRIIN